MTPDELRKLGDKPFGSTLTDVIQLGPLTSALHGAADRIETLERECKDLRAEVAAFRKALTEIAGSQKWDASKYAARVKDVPPFKINTGLCDAVVVATWTTDGHLHLLSTGEVLTQDEALDLAAWIQRTFGEKPK